MFYVAESQAECFEFVRVAGMEGGKGSDLPKSQTDRSVQGEVDSGLEAEGIRISVPIATYRRRLRCAEGMNVLPGKRPTDRHS